MKKVLVGLSETAPIMPCRAVPCRAVPCRAICHIFFFFGKKNVTSPLIPQRHPFTSWVRRADPAAFGVFGDDVQAAGNDAFFDLLAFGF